MAEEAERGQRPTAQCQLLASPQLRGYGVLLLIRSGLVYMLVCGPVSVCVRAQARARGMTLNPVWLRPNRTEALTVTDKRQAPPVKSTWHQASFSLADAKSMTEALAGGKASPPAQPPPSPAPSLPSSAGLKIQRQASSIRESLLAMMMTISLCLRSPCYLNPSLSCLLTPSPPPPTILPPPPPSLTQLHDSSSSRCRVPSSPAARSGSPCQTSVYLRSCQAKKSRRADAKNSPADFYQV